VLIVSGPTGGARRYRGDHRREQLGAAGCLTDVCYRSDVDLAEVGQRYGCVVLYRVPWDDGVERLLTDAPTAGCTVVADFDDLVFDPRAAHWIRGLDAIHRDARAAYIAEISQMRRTLEACGRATVSTGSLERFARDAADRVAVVHNVVSRAMMRDGLRAARRKTDQRRVRIGYLSGTPTHDTDFLDAADSLLDILQRHETTNLVVAGFLELDERFDRFGRRVERLPYRAWQKLPALLASIDVSIAPLERGSPFTDGKSALKYLEAAIVGVPTVATPTDDFRRVIRDGENGFLADGADAWRAILEELVRSKETRKRVGEAALDDVRSNHTTDVTAESAAAALREAAS
jgi:O-antigen biosynthesis protein